MEQTSISCALQKLQQHSRQLQEFTNEIVQNQSFFTSKNPYQLNEQMVHRMGETLCSLYRNQHGASQECKVKILFDPTNQLLIWGKYYLSLFIVVVVVVVFFYNRREWFNLSIYQQYSLIRAIKKIKICRKIDETRKHYIQRGIPRPREPNTVCITSESQLIIFIYAF